MKTHTYTTDCIIHQWTPTKEWLRQIEKPRKSNDKMKQIVWIKKSARPKAFKVGTEKA
jgi:hypothetical protein